jgi:hypothetical protein
MKTSREHVAHVPSHGDCVGISGTAAWGHAAYNRKAPRSAVGRVSPRGGCVGMFRDGEALRTVGRVPPPGERVGVFRDGEALRTVGRVPSLGERVGVARNAASGDAAYNRKPQRLSVGRVPSHGGGAWPGRVGRLFRAELLDFLYIFDRVILT